MELRIKVDAPADAVIGIKETVCMTLERWGNAKVVEILDEPPEQMEIGR